MLSGDVTSLRHRYLPESSSEIAENITVDVVMPPLDVGVPTMIPPPVVMIMLSGPIHSTLPVVPCTVQVRVYGAPAVGGSLSVIVEAEDPVIPVK